jgi:Tol biopolymer transport system component/tRNA A-37 threonylcarbamoyl transferase component Bud32
VIGQTLSHYRITAALGTGGMGEVYRATDTNLNRDVAIKVLPPEVARDPERLARFKREAHVLAALNHPHIASIYGLEESGGQPFLALELVEGEDLKQRLARGAIPVDEALEIARQIAEALEDAHNKGIVHRDLKPANVKLTADGKAKVLDFGLAKAWAGDGPAGSASSALSQSPTLAHTGTVAGLILGTAAYMSPEQARGKPVDKRADVWSFGVLLWEMLTGRQLFTGDTVTDVIAAVVTREPDVEALPKATPPSVRRLIARCLRKDPRTRLPDIGAARLDLQEALVGAGSNEAALAPAAIVAAGAVTRARARERWGWIALTLALAGFAAWMVWQKRHVAAGSGPPVHFVLEPPDGLGFPDFQLPALSPDGRFVAFAGLSRDGSTQIWLRSLDSDVARPIAGTEGGILPFWSPDSAVVGFAAGNEIRKVGVAGGALQRVCALPRPGFNGGTWNAQGTIILASGGASGTLFSVPAAGGQPTPFTTLDASRAETVHFLPQFLPDGRHVLFGVNGGNAGVYVAPLDAPTQRRLVEPGPERAVYASGCLLRVRDGILSARRFDPRRLEATGDAIPVVSNVATWSVASFFSWFSASETGRLTWVSGRDNTLRLAWFDRGGNAVGTLGEPARYGQLALSPDGRRVAAEVADAEGHFDIWLLDAARGVASRLTTDPANEREPVWSPDGTRLAFTTGTANQEDILVKDLTSSQPAAPLPGGFGTTAGVRDIPENWTGDSLIFMTLASERTFWTLRMDGKSEPERLMAGAGQFGIDEPHLSPDGRWLAFVSTESGRFEVYVEPFRRKGERLRVSTNGGGQPRWKRDGKELFYLSTDRSIVAVTVRETAAGLELGAPTTIVAAERMNAIAQGGDYDDWDLAPDGQRFLVKVSATPNQRQQIHVLLDWPELVQ